MEFLNYTLWGFKLGTLLAFFGGSVLIGGVGAVVKGK